MWQLYKVQIKGHKFAIQNQKNMRLLSLLFTVVVSVVAFAQVPTITNVSPKSGNPGTSVTITGTNFVNGSTTNNVVYFGSVKATVTAATSTSLTVTVPNDASDGKISYTNLTNQKNCLSNFQFSTTWNGGGTLNSGSLTASFTQVTRSIVPVNISTGDYSWTDNVPFNPLGSGDFNLDGKIDLVVATGNGTSSALGATIYTNASTGIADFTFGSTTQLTTSNDVQTVAVADFNMDGKLDVAVASAGSATNSISIFINSSTAGGATISFNSAIVLTSNNAKVLKVSDINCDGKIDILYSTSTGDKIYTCLNSSTNSSTVSFSSASVLITTSLFAFEVGDVNNDSKPDIMVGAASSRPKLFVNGATAGVFSSTATFTVGSGTTYSSWAAGDEYVGNSNIVDFDNDGFADFSSGKSGSVLAFSRNTNSTTANTFDAFNTTSCDGCGFRTIGTVDIDGDGDVDLMGGAMYTPPRFQIMLNTSTSGNVTFASYLQRSLSGSTTLGSIVVDWDGNGKPEYITLTNPGTSGNSQLSIMQNKVGEVLGISQHPSTTAQTYCQNATATALTIVASGSSPTYQWEQSANGSSGWANVSAGTGATTTTYTPSTASAGTLYYRCKVTDASGSVYSNASGSYTVNAVVITTQPTTTAIVKCYGDAPQALTVATSSSSPTYQWQESTTSNGTYSNVTTGTGGTSSSFSPLHSNISWGNTKYYRCVITSNGCTATSNASAGYTIGNLAVTSNPSTSAQTYCQGASATPLTMTASANGLPITYMWQSATSVGGSFGSVVGGTGASTNTYTPPTSTAGTLYYRCYVTYCGGQATASAASGAITVNVNTAGAASSSPSVCINTAITNITHTTTGATGIGTASGLPAGVTAAWSANTITVSGTPTASGTFNYTIPLTGGCGSVNATGTITVNGLPTITTQPTTTAIVKCYGDSPQALTVATSASSPTYQWQESTTSNGTYSDVTTGTGGTTNSFSPLHSNISWGNTKYYRCVITSNSCTATSNASAGYTIGNLAVTSNPSTTAQTYCQGTSATPITMTASANGLPITYMWQSATSVGGSYGSVVGGTGASTNTYTPPTTTTGTLYYRCYISYCGGQATASAASGAITVTDTYTWTGATSTDPTVAGNWNPAAVPCSGANEVIPSGLTNYPVYTNLTIDAGTTLTVNTGGRLTVTGTLTNNGTMTIESGATFVQGTSLAGSGTYNVKQFVTGAGGSTPSGRFWYMGLPINNLSRQTAFGAASASNRLWSWSESAQAWSSQITDATALSPTTGYVFRTGADVTLTFTGTSLYSADASITGLTNTTGSFDGCHLMSNPYTAYLDWDQIAAAAGTTNLSSTVTVRSYNTSNSQMVYDTYNATGSVAVQNSSYAVSKYIAPMQSFWVVVNPSTTGTLSMTKAMLTHQPTAPGLKDLTSFPAFARLNLVDGSFTDQVVVYTDAEANAELEAFDSKKFFLPNVAQVYCKVGNDKLVINALKKGKAQTSAPLTVELPTTKVYKFEMAESFVESGLVILEDRQEGIFQDMGINPTYEFFGNSGVIADRFVLHFQLPNGASNEGQAGVEDLTSSQIAVISNQNGSILVSLSADLTATGEVQVLDAAGRLIQTTAIKGQDTKLQITEGTGVYFVRVSTPMKSETKKVLVY
jgi:hypothetical protein